MHARRDRHGSTATGGGRADAGTLTVDAPAAVPAKSQGAGGRPAKVTHQEIAALAYSYWEARGGQWGSPWEDWFRAERELERRREP